MGFFSTARPARWIIPGVLTVAAVTLGSVYLTEGRMEADIDLRGDYALADAGLDWAKLSIDGRDGTLSGLSTNAEQISRAESIVSGLYGLRSLDNQATLAPTVTPYPFMARKAEGAITLTGGIPDERARDALLGIAPTADDQLELLSGYPDRDSWVEAASFALSQLDSLEEGEVALDGLDFSLAGRAADRMAFNGLNDTLAGELPGDLTRGTVALEPPLVSPYVFNAAFNDSAVSLDGNVPSADAEDRITGAIPDSFEVNSTLVLSSGAPEGFVESAVALIGQLIHLENGAVEIIDNNARISGRPADAEVAESVTAAVTALQSSIVDIALDPVEPAETPSIVDLEDTQNPPADDVAETIPAEEQPVVDEDTEEPVVEEEQVTEEEPAQAEPMEAEVEPIVEAAPEPFTWSAEGGGLDATLSEQIAAAAEAENVPADFAIIAGHGLAALANVETGAVRFDGTVWSFAGRAADEAGREAALAALAADPQPEYGWVAQVTAPAPEPEPVVEEPAEEPAVDEEPAAEEPVEAEAEPMVEAAPEPFTWSAEGGGLDATLSEEIAAAAEAENAPADFAIIAGHGLAALTNVETGAVRFNGTVWSFAGRAADEAGREAALAALAADPQPEYGWVAQVTAPAPEPEPVVEEPAEEPVVDEELAAEESVEAEAEPMVEAAPEPFTWSAEGGGLDATLSEEIAAAAEAENAPADFAIVAGHGLAALTNVETGAVRFDGTVWSFAGRAADEAGREAALAALAADPQPEYGWVAQVTAPAPEPEPVVEEPAEEPAIEKEPAAEEEPVVDEEPALEEEPVVDEPVEEPEVSAVEPVVVPYRWQAERGEGGAIRLSGNVPNGAIRDILRATAGAGVVDLTTVRGGEPENFLNMAGIGLGVLPDLAGGRLSYADGGWSLEGEAPSMSARADIEARLATAPQPLELNLTTPPPIDVCRAQVADFSAINTILFPSGSIEVDEGSLPALEKLAGYLEECPEAEVHVEGHTDSVGDAEFNLTLSLSRAENVVDHLIELGVDRSRLYAIGYGESLPIASNDTNDGRSRNRRIVFTVKPAGGE